MSATTVRVHDRGPVRTLVIDRDARRNAVDSHTLLALSELLGAADADPSVRVIVLTGAGERAFCAGIDLQEPEPDHGDPVALRRWRGRLTDLFVQAEGLATPLVCRLNGPALGGGVGLAAMSDLIVASDAAWLCLPEIDVARWPLAVGAVLLRRLPPQVVLDMAMTGRRVSAAEAAALHLIQRVVPAAKIDEAVDELTDLLAAKAPGAMAAGLRATRQMIGMSLADARVLAADVLEQLLLTDEGKEGREQFLAVRGKDVPPTLRAKS